ncbi:MAG: SGNH/GDSL hydrolase family protein [Clostridia bacterium]|nr:SGNH/GDSL hydrolase family protein [Clostridia bacterium]
MNNNHLENNIPDQNLQVPASIGDIDITMYSVRQKPFSIYGLYRPTEEPEFKRLPDEITKPVSENLFSLGRATAGGRVRFCTDSPCVAIRAVYDKVGRLPHMPLTGSAGFDLYIDDPATGTSRYRKTFVPPITIEDSYESIVNLNGKKLRYFTIHFPTYSNVRDLWVGVAPDATLGEGIPYRSMDPIVYYGSSITQGGCSSRPGNCYQNIISQRTNIDHINLGFSGNGKAEESVARYMATLPMSAFVSDYDHNAPNPEHLRNTHRRLYEIIREKHPDIPYIMISKPDFATDGTYEKNIERRQIITETYHYARAQGDTNAYYIDGSSFFRGPFAHMATVDGCHPNDIGFALMADGIESELRYALTQHNI